MAAGCAMDFGRLSRGLVPLACLWAAAHQAGADQVNLGWPILNEACPDYANYAANPQ